MVAERAVGSGAAVVGAAFAQGFLSMGFQLVASRMLAPFFGTTLVVWAFIISTFLAAFSVGAIAGGICSRLGSIETRRGLGVIALVGCIGFIFTAFAGRPLLRVIDGAVEDFALALGLASSALFFLPVAALSALLPIFTEVLSRRGGSGGLSSGIVYGVSTIGNISGVMITAFLLIPHFLTTQILITWAVSAVLCFWVFYLLVARAIMASQ